METTQKKFDDVDYPDSSVRIELWLNEAQKFEGKKLQEGDVFYLSDIRLLIVEEMEKSTDLQDKYQGPLANLDNIIGAGVGKVAVMERW